MSSIMTGIELQDNFSSVLYNVCSAVNLALTSMTDLQGTMGAEMNMAALEGARSQIDAATVALNEMNEAMQNASTPPVPTPPVPTPPTPTPEPFHWRSDALPVFNGTGMERFQREVQSANTMLQRLSSTQDSIARQAFQTNILSPEAFQDMNSLAVRANNLRERIQAISENPLNMGTEQANNALEQLRAQLNNAILQQNNLNEAMQRGDISSINDAYLRLSQTVSDTERYIRDNTDEQGRFNQQIRDGTSASSDLMNSIKGIVAAYASAQGMKNALDLSDELTQTTARLEMMSQGFEEAGMSGQELMQQVYISAQDARGSLSDMADVVARFGNNARDAFESPKEVIDFANLVQKQMSIAGASTQEAANAELQLSQALGSGVLRGDELNSIFEQAPNLIQNIADYLDVPIGQIREMASEGQLSADVVKAAIFSASDEINAKFSQMPMTWGQLWQSFQNSATMAFQPVLQRLNDMANSPEFQNFVNNAINAIAILADIVLNVFELMGAVAGFVADNWSVIGPIIYGVAAALLMYLTYLGIVNAIEIVSTAIKMGMVLAEYAHAAATGTAVAATTAETAAQMGLNTALLACPITWIILGIIALIAVIIAVANYIANTTDVAQSAFGVICGVVAMAGAFIFNNVIGIINAIIQAVWTIFVEPFIGIIEWVLNVANGGFDSFGGAVANLLGQIVSWFLSLGKIVTKIIDAIFGTNWTAGLEALQSSVLSWGKNENAITLDRNAPTFGSRIEYGAAFQAGANWGDSVADKVSNAFNKKTEKDSNYEVGTYDYTGAGAGSGIGGDSARTAANTGQTSANTAAIANSLDITNEQLKYLRDVAERDTVNRFTTAKIKVEMTNHNNVNSGMDLDGIVNDLTLAVGDAMSKTAEGVHT